MSGFAFTAQAAAPIEVIEQVATPKEVVKPPGIFQVAATNPAVRRALLVTLTVMAMQQVELT